MKKLLLVIALPVCFLLFSTCTKINESVIDPTKMYGDIMFWTDVNSNHSAISVTFRNVTRRITRSYTTRPDCGASGCVTFEEVPIGTYSYYATDNMGYWEGEVTVYYNECSSMKLTSSHNIVSGEDCLNSSCRIDFQNSVIVGN